METYVKSEVIGLKSVEKVVIKQESEKHRAIKQEDENSLQARTISFGQPYKELVKCKTEIIRKEEPNGDNYFSSHDSQHIYQPATDDLPSESDLNFHSNSRQNGLKQYTEKDHNTIFEKRNKDSYTRRNEEINSDEKTFPCLVCGKKFRSFSYLRQHEAIHTYDPKYQCSICDKRFKTCSNLKQHERMHSTERPYECTLCEKRFKTASNLLQHKAIHSGEKMFQCIVCDKRFLKSFNLRQHERIHTGYVNNFKMKTYVQSEVVWLKSVEEVVIKQEAEQDVVIKQNDADLLDACSTSFGQSNEKLGECKREIIIKEESINDEDFSSHDSQCINQPAMDELPSKSDFKFHSNSRQNGLKQDIENHGTIFEKRNKNSSSHNKEINSVGKMYQCLACGKIFQSSLCLRQHEAIHTDIPLYQCSMCEKKFKTSSNLRQHERVHSTERPFECAVCEKRFKTVPNLRQHEAIHSGEKMYQCTVCEKRFLKSSHLKQHDKTHTGEKTFQCVVCKKKFRTLSILKNHARLHTGERPYHCTICDKRFNTCSILRKHEQRHAVSIHKRFNE